MRKPLVIIALLSVMLPLLSAAPYLGVSQSPVSTSVELGYLTKSIDQNFTLSLPLLGSLDSGDDWYRYPVTSMNILYKKKIGTTVALGLGPTLRMGWEYEQALSLQAGIALQLSLEAVGVMDILFLELSYLPKGWNWLQGEPSSTLLEDGIRQVFRFGYRRAF